MGFSSSPSHLFPTILTFLIGVKSHWKKVFAKVLGGFSIFFTSSHPQTDRNWNINFLKKIKKSENSWFFVGVEHFTMFESPQNDFLQTPQNYKISVKFSGDLLFFFLVLGPWKLRFWRAKFGCKGPEATHSPPSKSENRWFLTVLWPFPALNRHKNDFLGTPHNSRISVKFSKDLLFSPLVFGPPKDGKKQKK